MLFTFFHPIWNTQYNIFQMCAHKKTLPKLNKTNTELLTGGTCVVKVCDANKQINESGAPHWLGPSLTVKMVLRHLKRSLSFVRYVTEILVNTTWHVCTLINVNINVQNDANITFYALSIKHRLRFKSMAHREKWTWYISVECLRRALIKALDSLAATSEEHITFTS